MINRFRPFAIGRQFGRWCTEEASASNRGSGLYHSSIIDQTLISNEYYNKGAELMKTGLFEKASKELELARYGEYKYNASVLMLLSRCLMERKQFEEAKRLLQLCDARHSGRVGLADMIEEANWGIELWGEHERNAKAKKDLYDEQMKKGVQITKHQILENHIKGQEIQCNLPMENHQRDYFRTYLGDAIEKIGMFYTPGKGRCIAAKKPIKAGEVLFEEKTVLFAPEYLSTEYKEEGKMDPAGYRFQEKGKQRPHKCSHCQAKLTETHKCSDCGLHYCSDKCQTDAALSYHNFECKILRSDAVKALRDRLISKGHGKMFQRWLAMVRCTSVALSENGKYANEQPWFDHLSYYEGEHKLVNVESVASEDHVMQPTISGVLAMIYAKLVLVAKHGNGVGQLPKDQLKAYTKAIDDDYYILFDRVKSNLDNSGVIYPFLTMVNHSCMPNAEFKAPGRLVATQAIRKNEEICISYSPANIPLDLRFNWLEKHKGFSCTCMYCVFAVNEQQVALREKNDSFFAGLTDKSREQRKEFNESEELVMPDGRYTKKGIEAFESNSENFLQKYPSEFRESLLQMQEKVSDDLKTKTVDEVRMDLTQRKNHLSKLKALGLASVSTEEEAAYDLVLDAVDGENAN